MTNTPPTNISPHAHISESACIGSHVTIGHGVVIPEGVQIGDYVCIGPNTVFVAGEQLDGLKPAIIGDQVRIGAGTIVYPNIRIESGACVLPGTVVTKSVPSKAIIQGNPAHITGYVDALTEPTSSTLATSAPKPIRALSVKGVSVHNFPVVPDLRGNLTVGEFDKEIPFKPKRYFMVYGVPSREIRGEHAHRQCHQFLICVRGSCAVVVDDGQNRAEINLDEPNLGVYLPPMTWGIQYKYSADALLLVFASHYYDAKDYIRNYDEFLGIVKSNKS